MSKPKNRDAANDDTLPLLTMNQFAAEELLSQGTQTTNCGCRNVEEDPVLNQYRPLDPDEHQYVINKDLCSGCGKPCHQCKCSTNPDLQLPLPGR
jgi:hypothetical protein